MKVYTVNRNVVIGLHANKRRSGLKGIIPMKESFKNVFQHPSESSEPEVQSYLGSADSVSLISFLRWSLPLCSAILAIGYVLFEHGILQGHSILDVQVIRTLSIVGLVSPALVWLALTWAEKATLRAVNTRHVLAHRTQELAALNAIGQATAQSLELGEITQIAIAKILELFDLDAVELRLLERDSLVLKAYHGVSADFVMEESSIG